MKRYELQFLIEDKLTLLPPVAILITVDAEERTEEKQNEPYEIGEQVLGEMGIDITAAQEKDAEVSVSILKEYWI